MFIRLTMNIKVADQAWIGLALLHREQPKREDFRVDEILERARREFGHLQPGVRQHLSSHAVAGVPPSPGNHRMFTRTGRGRLRLYRQGDPVHAKRHGKLLPNEDEVEAKYAPLLRWYVSQFNRVNDAELPLQKGEVVSGKDFLRFVGLIPAFDLKQMEEAIERDCERIESDTNEEIA